MKSTNTQNNVKIKSTFYTRFVKRFFDFTLSLLAILILSPILLICYILTLLFNGFPALYKQARPGKNHKVFFIYKFRSMTNKKDENGNLLPDNQRITWFGKFIRKMSIDELPQLFNILIGNMSIVGPRPRLVKDMVFYDKEVYDHYVVKPGLTGPTQAFGRNKNTWEEVFEKDMDYAQKVSLWYDIKIIFFTFFSVFKNTGESHSSTEEDKSKTSKEQEYYYADYMLRIGKITKEQYDAGLKLANEIIQRKGVIEFQPDLQPVASPNETTNESEILEESNPINSTESSESQANLEIINTEETETDVISDDTQTNSETATEASEENAEWFNIK